LTDDPPPANVMPMSFRSSSAVQEQYYAQWYSRLRQRINSEPLRQVPVMAQVSGKFSSFFEGREIPGGFGEMLPVRVSRDPLDEPIKDDPIEESDRTDREVPAPETEGPDKEATDKEATGTEGPDKETTGEGTTGEEATDPATGTQAGVVDAAAQDPEIQGPPRGTEQPEEDLDQERAPLFQAVNKGQIVVVGDSDFLRDDLVGTPARGPAYAQIGGPASTTGRRFFLAMLDWIHGDDDLGQLYNRNLTRRVLSFGEHDVRTERPEDFRQRLITKTSILRWLNILLPPLLLVAFGVVLALKRHAQKRAFLASVES
jgi:hypothetical protein